MPVEEVVRQEKDGRRPTIRLELARGEAGSLWPIKPVPVREIRLDADDWTVQLVPGLPAAVIRWHQPSAPVSVEEHRRKAERCLDVLSWEGAGHYELIPLDGSSEHLLWDWTKKTPRVQCTAAYEQKLAASIRSRPETGDDHGYQTRYHAALRYYRCAQTAPNPVAAFQNLYLAFEYLAAERVPMQEEEKGREKAWLQRALAELVTTYPKDVQEALPSGADAATFHKRIYEAARCATFHAKPYREPVAPFDEKEEEIRQAYRLLMPHVTELLRSATGWPEGHRTVSEEEVDHQGSVLVALETAGILLDKPVEPDWIQYDIETWEEGEVPRTFCFSTRLDPAVASSMRGIRWSLGPMHPVHWFTVFPYADEPMDVDVRLVMRARFDGLVRTPASPLDHITQLRSASKMRHKTFS